MTHKTTTPNVFIKINSTTLIQAGGLDPMWEQIKHDLKILGAVKIHKNIITRIDACVDVQIALSDFILAYNEHRIIKRARKQTAYNTQYPYIDNTSDPEADDVQLHRNGNKDTGMSIGKGIMLRIYDKIEELKRNPLKAEIVAQYRCGQDELPETLTRFEFQVRGKALKNMLATTGFNTFTEIRSVEDWIKWRHCVLYYLCTQWVRFSDEPIDRKHCERATTMKEWKDVTDAFQEWTRQNTNQPLRPITRKQETIKAEDTQMIKQALGAALTWYVLQGGEFSTIENFLDTFNKSAIRIHRDEPEKLPMRAYRKRLLIDSKLPHGVTLIAKESENVFSEPYDIEDRARTSDHPIPKNKTGTPFSSALRADENVVPV